MSKNLEIRESRPGDSAAIESLYPQAFPDENLLPLVRDLLSSAEIAVSLVGTVDLRIAGHAIFTKCAIVGSPVTAALLGPLAVAPARQKQGIGSALVRDGLQRLADAGTSVVCVLGDPDYYRRFGFQTERQVEPPFRLPAEWDDAWQSLRLSETRTPITGKLSVPSQWLDPALWAP